MGLPTDPDWPAKLPPTIAVRPGENKSSLFRQALNKLLLSAYFVLRTPVEYGGENKTYIKFLHLWELINWVVEK